MNNSNNNRQRNNDLKFAEKAPPIPPHIKDVYFLKQKELRSHRLWKNKSSNSF